jgi:hypothetical protein
MASIHQPGSNGSNGYGRDNEERRSNTSNNNAASARASSLVDAILSRSQRITNRGLQTVLVYLNHSYPTVNHWRRHSSSFMSVMYSMVIHNNRDVSQQLIDDY